MPANDFYTQQLINSGGEGSYAMPIAAQNMAISGMTPAQMLHQQAVKAQSDIDATAAARQEPAGFLDNLSDKEQFLLDMGINMMRAGGRPGANLLSSAGEGAAEATKSTRQRKRDKIEDQRKADAQKMQELLAKFNFGKSDADMQMGEDKFGYQQYQDEITNSQRDRAFGLDQDRLSQQQYQFENPDGQIIQDQDGTFILAPKRGGGPAMPLMDQAGEPIVGIDPAAKAFEQMKQRAIADAAGQGRPASKLREISTTLDSVFGAPNPNNTAQAPSYPTQLFLQNALKQGYTPKEAEALLKKMQQKGK